MAGSAFDPKGAVRFDLDRGAASDTRGARLVVLPAAAIESALRDHPALAETLGAELGRACGEKIASRLGGGDGVRDAHLEVVVSQLAGELAVAGLGAVHLERWGRAMVCVLENPSVGIEAFLAAALAAALGAASGREVFAASIGAEPDRARFFIGARGTAERVRSLVAGGTSFASALAELQGGAA